MAAWLPLTTRIRESETCTASSRSILSRFKLIAVVAADSNAIIPAMIISIATSTSSSVNPDRLFDGNVGTFAHFPESNLPQMNSGGKNHNTVVLRRLV